MDLSSLKEENFNSNSPYIKPKRFTFTHNGKKCTWDFIEAKDSVSVLLYHKDKKSFVFVRQFRVPLWHHQKLDKNYKKDEKMGFSVELCSGLVDKNLSLKQIAREECIEELGYAPFELEKIGDFYTGFGSGVSKQSLFFAEIDENARVGRGGGIDDEEIEAVFVRVDEFENFTKNAIRTPLLDFSYFWFLKNKASFFGI